MQRRVGAPSINGPTFLLGNIDPGIASALWPNGCSLIVRVISLCNTPLTNVAGAEALRAAGLPCPVVSVGSTPTAHAATDLTGVTELRAGVYTFFDPVMAGINGCTLDDIALSVLTTVISHQSGSGYAGWMAMSRDRGTAAQALDQGYGVVCDVDGSVLDDLIMVRANQEHGVIACRPGNNRRLPELAIGTQLRILPDHACATAAQHGSYNVLPVAEDGPLLEWPRFGSW